MKNFFRNIFFFIIFTFSQASASDRSVELWNGVYLDDGMETVKQKFSSVSDCSKLSTLSPYDGCLNIGEYYLKGLTFNAQILLTKGRVRAVNLIYIRPEYKENSDVSIFDVWVINSEISRKYLSSPVCFNASTILNSMSRCNWFLAKKEISSNFFKDQENKIEYIITYSALRNFYDEIEKL